MKSQIASEKSHKSVKLLAETRPDDYCEHVSELGFNSSLVTEFVSDGGDGTAAAVLRLHFINQKKNF